MAKKAKKGKRRPTAKRLQPKRGKETRRTPAKRTKLKRAERAGPKRPKRVGSKSLRAAAERRRAQEPVSPKPKPEDPFQLRRVVIRFQDGFNAEQERRKLTEQYGRIVLRPTFDAAREAVERLQDRARRQDPRYSLPNFRNYYFLYLLPGREPAEVARELRDWPTIGSAYVDAPTEDAQASQQMCLKSSGHIEGLGEGVNARVVWPLPGGKGDGQVLVDVERGWTPGHDRLPTNRINLVCGVSLFGRRHHGTSVLGIVSAQHLQGGGCEGIAPNVAYVGLASCAPDPQGGVREDDLTTTNLRENVYDAIAIAIDELHQKHVASPQNGPGVLLLEQQTDQGLPVETYELIQGLLMAATATDNITVVEAAGNAQYDLDVHPDAQVLGLDSGAIVVGSAQRTVIKLPAPHHARFSRSNFGGRVNCYAWGEGVVTPAWKSGYPNTPGILNLCDDQFGDTSAAAAIIAGVALVVQGIRAKRGRPPLSASQLRAILSNPALGTPCAPGDLIGVMPDLGKIAPTL
jgi:serine protease